MHPLALVVCGIVPGIVCAAAHYIPWRHWYKSGRVPRLYAYAIGTAAINVPVFLAALLGADAAADVLWLLVVAILSAFAGTAIPWQHDEQKREQLQQQREADWKELHGE